MTSLEALNPVNGRCPSMAQRTAMQPRTEAPQPLVREIPKGQPYPIDALGPLTTAVQAVHEMTLAPVALPAQSALATASLAVQGFADVETLGGRAPLSIYCLSVARSGERKSASYAPFLAAIREHEQEQSARFRQELSGFKNQQALWKHDRDALLKAAQRAKGEKRSGAEVDLEALRDEPVLPLLPERIITEPTFEGLVRLFSEGQPSLAIFSDEGGQFLGGHAMNSENRQKTLAALNDLWTGAPIKRARQGEGTYTLYGRRLAVHLMVQPIVARAFIADGLAGGTGFLPRFLITEPTSTIGTRIQSNVSRDRSEIESFSARLREILNTPMHAGHNDQELAPRLLTLTNEARTLLVDFADRIELAQSAGGHYAHASAYASKSAEHACRIAGVLTMWSDLNAQHLDVEAMECGLHLAQFYLDEAVRLADAAAISTETEQAELLRKWALEIWPARARNESRNPTFILPSDVMRFGPSQLREGKIAKARLKILEDNGWLKKLSKGAIVDGKPRTLAYRIIFFTHEHYFDQVTSTA